MVLNPLNRTSPLASKPYSDVEKTLKYSKFIISTILIIIPLISILFLNTAMVYSNQSIFSGGGEESATSTTITNSTGGYMTLNFSYIVVGNGTPAAPRIQFVKNNQTYFETISSTPKPITVDYGSKWVVDSPLSGSSTEEQWAVAVNNDTAVLNSNIPLTYYHQFRVSVSYATSYGEMGTGAHPNFTFTQFGHLTSHPLTKTPNSIWADANSRFSADQVVSGRSGERWQNITATEGTVSIPDILAFTYAHQFLLSISTDPQTVGSVLPGPGWYNTGSVLQITATSTQAGYAFDKWVGEGNGSYSGFTNPVSITMNDPIIQVAHFRPSLNVSILTLTGVQLVVVDGQQHTLNSSAIINQWIPNSTHTITALEGASCGFAIGPLITCQWKFKGWYMQDGTLITKDETLQLTVNKARTVVGVWEKNYLPILIPIAVLATIAAIIILLLRKPRKRRGPEPQGPPHISPPQVRGLNYRLGFLTDVGKVRSNNEDSIIAVELASTFESKTDSSILCAVADGVGGSQKGEIASRLALQTLAAVAPKSMLGSNQTNLESNLRTAIESANESLVKYGMEHPESEGLATTIVASVISNGTAYITHAGDSRAYLINRGEIKQLTKDDSQVQELVDSGKLTADEARHYPGRNVITRAVGAATDIEVSTSSLALAPGDYIMLCSDGLWEPVTDAEIQKTILESPTPQSACDELVALANQKGGRDNASIVIVQIQSQTQ